MRISSDTHGWNNSMVSAVTGGETRITSYQRAPFVVLPEGARPFEVVAYFYNGVRTTPRESRSTYGTDRTSIS